MSKIEGLHKKKPRPKVYKPKVESEKFSIELSSEDPASTLYVGNKNKLLLVTDYFEANFTKDGSYSGHTMKVDIRKDPEELKYWESCNPRGKYFEDSLESFISIMIDRLGEDAILPDVKDILESLRKKNKLNE